MDRACVGAGAALPATMNVLTTWQGSNFFLHVFIVVLHHPGLDERAPVSGDINPVHDQLIVRGQVFGANQAFFMNGHQGFR
jgi:hypothetical protein